MQMPNNLVAEVKHPLFKLRLMHVMCIGELQWVQCHMHDTEVATLYIT